MFKGHHYKELMSLDVLQWSVISLLFQWFRENSVVGSYSCLCTSRYMIYSHILTNNSIKKKWSYSYIDTYVCVLEKNRFWLKELGEWLWIYTDHLNIWFNPKKQRALTVHICMCVYILAFMVPMFLSCFSHQPCPYVT